MSNARQQAADNLKELLLRFHRWRPWDEQDDALLDAFLERLEIAAVNRITREANVVRVQRNFARGGDV